MLSHAGDAHWGRQRAVRVLENVRKCKFFHRNWLRDWLGSRGSAGVRGGGGGEEFTVTVLNVCQFCFLVLFFPPFFLYTGAEHAERSEAVEEAEKRFSSTKSTKKSDEVHSKQRG